VWCLEKGNTANEMNAMGWKGEESHFSRSYMNDGLNKTVKNRTRVEYKIQLHSTRLQNLKRLNSRTSEQGLKLRLSRYSAQYSHRRPFQLSNSLNTEFLLNNIYKFSPYLTGSTLHLRYRDQPVRAVQGNSRCLLWEPYGTYRYTVQFVPHRKHYFSATLT
jgi:hypothetical protein